LETLNVHAVRIHIQLGVNLFQVFILFPLLYLIYLLTAGLDTKELTLCPTDQHLVRLAGLVPYGQFYKLVIHLVKYKREMVYIYIYIYIYISNKKRGDNINIKYKRKIILYQI
jgi:hypothetical protein